MIDHVSDILREQESVSDSVPDDAPRSHAARRQDKAPTPAPINTDKRDCLVLLPDGLKDGSGAFFRQSFELVAVARDGGLMIVGWADDADCPMECITVSAATWRVTFDAKSLVRVRRPDVEAALGTPPYPYGFFGMISASWSAQATESVRIDIRLRNGGDITAKAPCKGFGAEELRDLALGYLASASFMGNHAIEAAAALDHGLGDQIVALNRSITQRITGARHVERFGMLRGPPRGSIVVCLYGKPEFLFVQNALFAGLPGIEDYEFVFVCNSPEMSEALLAEAAAAHAIYGLRQTIVLLPGNAGFGAANNAGVAAALGRRILNVNPDVFPRARDWAAQHTALVESAPAEQTKLFGTTLYYDDGSLMHGGMYFRLDPGVTIRSGAIEQRHLARVEHYGKGAPDWAGTHVQPRPVPALTGAFVSSDRAWYESLGGFTEDYVFGHYEDADLCLKSLAAGTPAWLHDIRMWHLEGKGSTRKPHHEGGSLVNRWLFTRSWANTIRAGLTGPTPSHKAMQMPMPGPQQAAAMPARTQISPGFIRRRTRFQTIEQPAA